MGGSSSRSGKGNGNSGLLELELWHKWTYDTYKDFSCGVDDTQLWQVLVPKLALQSDFLRNAILAIAALHIAIEHPSASSSSPYILAALEYHDVACEGFRDLQTGRDDGHHDQREKESDNDHADISAVFDFSLINLALSLGFSQCPSKFLAEDERTSILQTIVTFFGLMQGVRSIISANLSTLAEEPFSVDMDYLDTATWQGLNSSTAAAFTRLKKIVDAETRGRDHSGRLTSSSAEDHHFHEPLSLEDDTTYYGDSIGWLEKCFGHYSEEDREVCLIWPLKLTARFITSLESRDSLAQLILLHWAILFDRLSHRFARDSGKMLVAELSAIIPTKDALWQEAVQWVRQEASVS